MNGALYSALAEAIVDEYRARARYRMVVTRFGPVYPFVNIGQAEERYIRWERPWPGWP
jgi:hypothetical protein